MKLAFPIANRQLPIGRHRRSERAVALVITLVLLAVITFMAVTFLVVSRSQHGTVATETDKAVARLAADTARDRAIVQLLAPMITWTNAYGYGLVVSTNYISSAGFDPAAVPFAFPNPTNVNYDYTIAGSPLNQNEWLENIANLLYDPRPPVFITNYQAANSTDFRYYLDLNRNGRYDTNGFLPVIDTNGLPVIDPNSGLIVRKDFIGDPEWIGVLQRPEYAHSRTNYFVSRYAYAVVPAGQTLDVNYVHNDAKQLDLDPSRANDGFLRNQGVGAWEINLAAFLADLNTNVWLPFYRYYDYTPTDNPDLTPNSGVAFEDASRLLWYRYSGRWDSLASASALFPGSGVNAFGMDFMDDYTAGPLMTNTWWPVITDADIPRVNRSWSGADNPNRFFTTQDLFDRSKIPATAGNPFSFVDRLQMAGTNDDSYNRYTFYRLLSQLGTDSAPEPSGKMNLNYRNVDDNGYVVPDMATNFIPWQPAQFFTNAVIRLLADAGYAAGAFNSTSNLLVRGSNYVNGAWLAITNLQIPIWPTNYYTPSVHRLLQVAANVYDATTNRADLTAYPFLPTVFRPIFNLDQARRLFIVGYREVTAADTDHLVGQFDAVRDPSELADLRGFDPLNDMVYNIPLVIGAKKGFPNFNEFGMRTLVQVTRKLQFHRPGTSATAPVNEIDQMFVVGISNVLGVEAWNSYATAFPRELKLVAWPDVSLFITNRQTGKVLNAGILTRSRLVTPVTTNVPASAWLGYDPSQEWRSFEIPLATNIVFLTNAIYHWGTDSFGPLTGQFERTPGSTNLFLPEWTVSVKPRLRFAVVDTLSGRMVDYVNLANDTTFDLASTLARDGACSADPYIPNGNNGSLWCTNRLGGSLDNSVYTIGIRNQIEASMGHIDADWNSSTHEFPPGMDKAAAIQFFKGQFIPGYPKSTNAFNAPFQPYRNMYVATSWQANDPLVHYNVGDLEDLTARAAGTNVVLDTFTSSAPDPIANLGLVNGRYEPWGRVRTSAASPTIAQYDMALKDPVSAINRPEGHSDDWDFPANKLPNIGWVGRVHRGTPWQTVYLKSPAVDLAKWQLWSGNGVIMTNFGQIAPSLYAPIPVNAWYSDALFAQPTNDWRLLDLFTTALNDNATRGQLSVNQTNLAAWSAVLSGVLVFSNFDNNGDPGLFAKTVEPAGVYNPFDTNTWPPLVRLVNRINDYRQTNNARHVFTRLGDVLGVPELTVASPFLNTNVPPGDPAYALNDAAIERLPQQIAGLLKVDTVPRFVIYAFGQTLKPTQPVSSGPFAGLCTNYQIVAEAATRTVVRFEGVQPYQGTNMPITSLHPVIESYNDLPPD